jgi:integrase
VKSADGLQLRGKTYWTDFYFRGQRIRKSLRTRDLATALERLRFLRTGFDQVAGALPRAEAAAKRKRDQEQASSEPSGNSCSGGFAAVADAYVADLRLRTDKRNSIRCAEYQVGQLLRVIPGLKRRAIKRDDLRKFIEIRKGEGVSAATINQGLSVYKSILRFGAREGLARDPGIDFKSLALKKTTRDRYLAQKQIQALFKAAKLVDARVYPLLYLAYYSGARLGELLELRWGWIDLEEGRVQIRNTTTWSPKAREGRVFYIPEDALRWLREFQSTLSHAGPEDHVLQMKPGRPWTEHVHKVLRKVFDACGIDSRIGVHGLRHSSVTDMLESGVPIHLVQQHHGHKDSTTTLRHYAHAREGALRDAARTMAKRRAAAGRG